MLQEWAGDKRFKVLVFLVLACAATAGAAYTYLAYTQAQYASGSVSTISVSGTSKTFLKPDIATFTYAVSAEGEDPAAAQEKAAKISNETLAYLKSQGVDDKDVKTVNYSLSPKYEYQTALCPQGSWGGCPPGTQKLVGYTVDEAVMVKVRKVEAAGDLLGGVGGKGATNISGLSFTVDDDEAAKAQVRAEAITDAKEKAQRLARSLGVRLGKIVNFYEDGNVPMPMTESYGGSMLKSADMALAPRVAPGENQLMSNVTLVYEIR